MPEREFDGQLAVSSTQRELLRAVHDRLGALARGLNFVPYNARHPGFQSAPGSRSHAAQPSFSVTRARR